MNKELKVICTNQGTHFQHNLQELFSILYDIQYIFTTTSKLLQCAFKKVKILVKVRTKLLTSTDKKLIFCLEQFLYKFN